MNLVIVFLIFLFWVMIFVKAYQIYKLKKENKPKPKPKSGWNEEHMKITCSLCGFVRTEESYLTERPNKEYWLGIGPNTNFCPTCLAKHRQEKPHCDTCSCEGKVKDQKPLW